MKVRLVDPAASAEELAPVWSRLHDEAALPHPFLSWEWLSPWMATAPPGAYSCIVVEDKGEPVAIVPLAARGGPFRRTWQSAAQGSGADYFDVLWAKPSGDAAEALAAALQGLAARRTVHLGAFRGETEDLQILRGALANAGAIVDVDVPSRSPHIDLVGSFDEYYAQRPARIRHNLRTVENKLRREGIEPVIEHRSDIEPGAFAEIADVHRRRQDARVGPSMFDGPAVAERLGQSLARAASRNWVELSTLRIHDRMAAFALSFRMQRTYGYWVASLHPDFSKYSPGQLLLRATIRRAFAARMDSFNFMMGEEPYKAPWAHRAVPDVGLTVWGRSGWSRAGAAAWKRLRAKVAGHVHARPVVSRVWRRWSKIIR